MSINFIPNDPLADETGSAGAKSIAATPDRPAEHSGIFVTDLPAEAQYGVDTPEFVAWQAREAALRAIVAFEEAYGSLPGWRGEEDARRLELIPIAGDEFNAYYDRNAIATYRFLVGGKPAYAGASTDVVAHETGHAILDAMRPDLWGVNMMEPSAFHEGFGDCVAIHTALADREIRQLLLAQGLDLRRANFVEALAEQLSDAVRREIDPQHNAASPRRAFNAFQWKFPASLPVNGPPGSLINEEHSLGQIVSGVFYELICGLFEASDQSEASLHAASNRAMKLAARAAAKAPLQPRFFESWGRSMAVVDRTEMNGEYQQLIKAAFSSHGIMVGSSNFLSPRVQLGGREGPTGEAGMRVSADNRRLVRAALDVEGSARLTARPIEFGAQQVVELSAQREVQLNGIDPRLEGVMSQVPRPAIVGRLDGSTALLGVLDPGFTYDSEVRAFASSLTLRGAIDFGRSIPPGTGFVGGTGVATHRVATERGRKVLKRKAFVCGCVH